MSDIGVVVDAWEEAPEPEWVCTLVRADDEDEDEGSPKAGIGIEGNGIDEIDLEAGRVRGANPMPIPTPTLMVVGESSWIVDVKAILFIPSETASEWRLRL